MKGFVPTPAHLVDTMVEKLFRVRKPRANEWLLDPGCGTGVFIQGVLRWCHRHCHDIPNMVGIDSDPVLLEGARRSLSHVASVTLLHEDFLSPSPKRYDYIIGNPPYVPITGLTTSERTIYRKHYVTAVGRFDLYLLFFEQALRLLKQEGRLVFVTPEKFLYVQTAAPLRREFTKARVEEIELIDESSFGGFTTYPTITTVVKGSPASDTTVKLREGTTRQVSLNTTGMSWLSSINRTTDNGHAYVLADAFTRISCGVATGADGVYVLRDVDLPESLRSFAKPSLSGRKITIGGAINTSHSLLLPYTADGALIPEQDLGALGEYLRESNRHARLLRRTCAVRKPWYAFHETPPLNDILQPKILCKDIGSQPYFVVDETGDIVPRHSVYYLVPRDPATIHEICAYLNSDYAQEWLLNNCQRAANGFIRLQSHVLKRMPVARSFIRTEQLACV